MAVIDSISQLRTRVRNWRDLGEPIAFVPTMGNLHDGHLSLVKTALARADHVIVSIFVNPLQFNDKTDLNAYPRTIDEDIHLLSELGCELVFTPSVDMIYPQGMDEQTIIHVPGTDDKLCGLRRPGHFDGVATVVCKLFNLVQPDMAFFGEKDYQQLLMIKKLVVDFNMMIEIVALPTARERSGLAMSSRNNRLTQKQLTMAPLIYQQLCSVKHAIESGNHEFRDLCQQASEQLKQAGFEPEYFEIRDADHLFEVEPGVTKSLRILVAANLGKVRLIDNIACNLA